MSAVAGKESDRLSDFIDLMTMPREEEGEVATPDETNVIELAAWVNRANSMMSR